MARMVLSAFFFKSLLIFLYRFFFRPLKDRISINNNNITFATQLIHERYHSLHHRSDLNDHTLIFDVEGALLTSSSVFPYFMLVAFEAGGLLRAIVLLLAYPFVCLVGEETGMKIMVMVCFFGIRKERFRVGSAVLPKFFLEDVGEDMFEVVKRGGRKVGLTKLPRVMVESFLKEYLEIDFVVGRELKVFNGFYVGLMEETKAMHDNLEMVREGKGNCSDIIGISGFHKDLDHSFFSSCKEVYTVGENEKRNWKNLGREKYPKPLIFHDGRLALKPTPLTTLAILMWLPFGFTLSLIRIITALTLPQNISIPMLAFSGLRPTTSRPKAQKLKAKGNLYACNHRTLLDPLSISFALKRDLMAVTYSLSKVSEMLAPIKTVRLTRNRSEDAKKMKRLLKQGDLVVCPEGTTCREPYLLRFSPLFSEVCDEIVPVAIDSHVTMFHGSTAGGFKCFDPFFFLMNPTPSYTVRLLEKVSPSSVLATTNNTFNLDARFEVANHVQTQIGKALGFQCTQLNRRDKYLTLAGNEGA
ncbi:probable glycerol-3-phosphate acyltransferase 2 [Cajanus cajan]|uniref:Glycerol-3-phosphate acyltransferase 2 n=1 Tax=Cajanus cajan TaxID=3821 RepID=A0A151RYG4_CAJCA|nr:probable glycerol-3-phosphate acyltransferase 2 [Cajanus cajan]KYP47595.1 putative glycerol-3-phosphate acyltransferase 2 [Cajanus cajan]